MLLCYQQGLEVGRYISLERLIEQNKERYYETLKLSSEGWHQGKHNPWHYINFLLYTLLDASNIDRRNGAFQPADLQRDCPGVGMDLMRRILKEKRKSGQVDCELRGPKSLWHKTDKWKLGTA